MTVSLLTPVSNSTAVKKVNSQEELSRDLAGEITIKPLVYRFVSDGPYFRAQNFLH